MITGTLVGDDYVIARLTSMPAIVAGAVRQSVEELAIALTAKVKGEKLSGQVLKNQSGTLRRSVNYQVQATENLVMASVGTNVEYAAIHEYGGKTPPHEIIPKHAKALKFELGGKTIFAKRVKHPGSQIPERSFLRSALREMEPIILQKITADVQKAVKI